MKKTLSPQVWKIIDEYEDLINQNDFEPIYKKLADNYTETKFIGEFTAALLGAEINPTFYFKSRVLPEYFLAKSDLEELPTISDKILYVSEFAFANMKNLRIADLSTSQIVKIRSNSFKECENLIEVKFPSSLEFLGSQLFKNCKKLEEITIPAKVSYIGIGAFYHCENLIKVKILRDADEFLDKVLVATSSFATVNPKCVFEFNNKTLTLAEFQTALVK